MTPGENIRERILACLRRQEPDAAIASEYASLCSELNRRLEQIEDVLEQGDEIQALQMAEIYPPVMEEADTLSFSRVESGDVSAKEIRPLWLPNSARTLSPS